ncbi:protein of unknown function [Sterolibacterium denitrificans]|uniref:Uncharacterized protein n=2 Tax=Sterolibacterium denitrificans TaxID=157592 RepID=A0A7Z7HSK9_9PROT|nr:flagellar protein FliT [Sterolibacterium denitrificans]KYC29294.1 hypothetical protein ACY05_01790 [Sterolibacterium denitrificans]SMB30528.1 protein of unknown function [Sterolibacterium denitrificans]
MPGKPAPVGYQEMHILSAHMLAAVERNDWDRVIELENQIAALRDHLIAHPVPVTASEEEIAEQRRLIRQIILDHESVRHQAQPKLEETRQQLGTAANQRRVDQAYGSNDDD